MKLHKFSITSVILALLVLCELSHAHYSPELGNFLSRDPIEEDGGVNQYAFAERDPINNLDLLGLYTSNNKCVVKLLRVMQGTIPKNIVDENGNTIRDPDHDPSILVDVENNGNLNIIKHGSTERQSAFFTVTALFEDPCKCCEVRQYIKWSKGAQPYHPGNSGWNDGDFKPDTWHEDRAADNSKYGHRADDWNTDYKDYKIDKNGNLTFTNNREDGNFYQHKDRPTTVVGGIWNFRIDVIDTCNEEKVVDTISYKAQW